MLDMKTHIANGFQRVLLAGSEHSQHIGLHVNLHLLIRLQLITQPDIRLARIQLPPALPTSVIVVMMRILALMADDDLWSLQYFPWCLVMASYQTMSLKQDCEDTSQAPA